MNRFRNLRSALTIAGLAALTAGGCAAGQSGSRVGTGDVVADRQRLMKLNGASWADVQAKMKTGNVEAIAVNAETMALNAMHIPTLFPSGSLTDKSKAKPDVWEKWAEFEGAAKNFVTWSEKLRDTARTKDAAATEAVMKEFGGKACGTCHTPFRVPPPRS